MLQAKLHGVFRNQHSGHTLGMDFTRFTRRFSGSNLQPLKLHWTQLIEMAVTPLSIVKHFDVFKYL